MDETPPQTPHEPASWRTGHPAATAKTTREAGQKFRLILIWHTAKMSRNKGCLSPRIGIRPVSPPASYYHSFRRLYIQVIVSSTQYLAVQRSALDGGSKQLFIMKPWDRMTAPNCPLVSKWSDDWPHRRLAKNRGTLCSRDCLTSAICKHCESNTWKQLTGTHRCDCKLPMATTWNKYVVINIIPRSCKWSSVSAIITPRNSLWQFKTGVFTCSMTRVNFASGPPWPVKHWI